tara:strand:+ start:162 stop:380 length:219 start_codon:yes stop_codon:yes gene_type:complete
MIGPQAYENLFQTAPNTNSHALFFNYEGKEYMYVYDWEDLELFNGFKPFLLGCIEDVQDRDGEYADTVEVIA